VRLVDLMGRAPSLSCPGLDRIYRSVTHLADRSYEFLAGCSVASHDLVNVSFSPTDSFDKSSVPLRDSARLLTTLKGSRIWGDWL
jgi:hypothetical protein